MPLEPLPESIGILVSDVARLFWRRLEAAFAADGLDFTAGEARVLVTVADWPGERQTRLAERLTLEPMTVTGHLDRLAARGLVERRPDPADRRAKLVEPTVTGRVLTERIRSASARVRAHMLTDVAPADEAALRTLLTRLRSALREEGLP